MEVVKTITLTEAERYTLAHAFMIMDEMSEATGNKTIYDICSWFCEYGVDYEDGKYDVQKCININDL